MAGSLPEMPCGPVLELNGQRKRFHVPFGLKPLMDVMIRNVLRDQPENIYEYLACFMENRVKKTDGEIAKNTKKKSWEVNRWSWQGGSILNEEELAEFLRTFPGKESEEAVAAAVVIQAYYRGYQAREEVKKIRKSQDSGNSGSKRASRQSDEDRYATVIQAAFRGHLARAMVKQIRNSRETEEEEEELNESDETETQLEFDDERNFAEDEEEDFTRTYTREDTDEETEEETEEAETSSGVEELGEEMELTMKSPTSGKGKLEKIVSQGELGNGEEGETEAIEGEDDEEESEEI